MIAISEEQQQQQQHQQQQTDNNNAITIATATTTAIISTTTTSSNSHVNCSTAALNGPKQTTNNAKLKPYNGFKTPQNTLNSKIILPPPALLTAPP
ncbi:hypothetical protein EVAR_69480_1 [Eumeta japonica]|uniref:Uncharacterized protein n=1 Tax=Eumeta variegata TaxID=151549 RepID=A0A4C1SQ70_EUMVA|nr:hypothetical protein EVAR_69480_1 [Eumeta japonica]